MNIGTPEKIQRRSRLKSFAKEDFENRIDRVTESGCWIWMMSTDRKGYGKATYKKKSVQMHRVSWEVHNGPIPKDLFVCHHCDVPSCVNPSHLFLGTCKDNLQDMAKKGRSHQGRCDPKLNKDMVVNILNDTRTNTAIAKELGVTNGLVSAVKLGRVWGWVEGHRKDSSRRLTKENVLAIREDSRHQSQIALSYGITQSCVSAIKRRKIWKHV